MSSTEERIMMATRKKKSQKLKWMTQPDQVKQYGNDIVDPDCVSRWCQAFFYGGNTLRLWNEAVELKMAILTACSLQPGQKAVLVGKYAEESGLAGAVNSLIGSDGGMTLFEIGSEAVAAFKNVDNDSPDKLQWDFNYFDEMPDAGTDRVILFGSPAHIRNREGFARQVDRVLRDGGRLIIADLPWGGSEMLEMAHMDTHLEGILDKLFSGLRITEADLIMNGPEEIEAMFKPMLSWCRLFSWHGLYLFYGQKNGGPEKGEYSFPKSDPAVADFLMEKPCTTPWDFLSKAEIEGLGKEITDVDKQKQWSRIVNWGGGFGQWERYSSAAKPMWDNLKIGPGMRALVIGEFLERLFLPELRKRMNDTGEIEAYDLNPIHKKVIDRLWAEGPDIDIPERHQWDYPFADKYPDDYFDLLWLPQGVHHARDWPDIAPRLVRTLKPGGQVIMLENRTGNPEFFLGLKLNGSLQCIADKIWWGWNMTLTELPDYSAEEIEDAFGDSLRDVYSLEWKGWVLLWGYKK